ncbi:hypothetical protein GJ744_011921 [Endocarpon pusillum]|uniref:Uncharacterized protein n=1 Tax=Endocarpon pusillum TaxID=364733 RepID=A0A8H7E950_9EURO|nr:hypothetical protein GJ744_011921 [Endocarpon pusillum]
MSMSDHPATPARGERPPGFPRDAFDDVCSKYIEDRKKALSSQVEETKREIQIAQEAGQNEKVEELKETMKNLGAAIEAYQNRKIGWGSCHCFQDGKLVQAPEPGKRWLSEGFSAAFQSNFLPR